MEKTIGNRTKQLRNLLGYRTQKEFAEKLSVGQSRISEIENDDVKSLDITFLLRLHEIGVNLHWWLAGEGYPMRNPKTEPAALNEPAAAYQPAKAELQGKYIQALEELNAAYREITRLTKKTTE